MPYSDICEIILAKEAFKVRATDSTGLRISLFLDTERCFHSSRKRLLDRLHYLGVARHGLFVPGFMPIWNRALMNGFTVNEVKQSDNVCEIFFTYDRSS